MNKQPFWASVFPPEKKESVIWAISFAGLFFCKWEIMWKPFQITQVEFCFQTPLMELWDLGAEI